MMLGKLPHILVLHYKRFEQDERGRLYKVNDTMSAPLELDMEPFCSAKQKQTKYDLQSIVVHLGNSLRQGHYVCYNRNPYDGKWYYTSDTSVKMASQTDVLRCQPYICFYEKKE